MVPASRIKGRAALVAAFGLAFGAVSGLVAGHILDGLDHQVNGALERIWWPPAFPLSEGIAVLAGLEVTSAVAVCLFLLLSWRRRWPEAMAMLAFPTVLVVEALVKLFVNHPGPPVTHAGQLTVTRFVSVQTSSYPSGHVLRSVVVTGLIAVLLRERLPARGQRLVTILLAALLVGVIAFDRLYLSSHWLSDVIGGLLLGGFGLAAGLLWLTAWESLRGWPLVRRFTQAPRH